MKFGYLLFSPNNAIFILTRQNKYAGQYRPVFVVPVVKAFYHGLKKACSLKTYFRQEGHACGKTQKREKKSSKSPVEFYPSFIHI